MSLFHGLSAFPLTPADDDGRVDTDALCALLERIVASGADSIGLLGSTGAYAFLSREERKRAVVAAVKCVGGRMPIIVGAGVLRTDQAQHLARDAAEAGADGLLLAPVSYTPLMEEEVFQHFSSVASAASLPLCIYNNPGTTKFVFSEDLIARLSGVPNIAAIKMPLPADGDFTGEIARLRAKTPKDFAIGYSGDWGSPEALLQGADCWYSVVAGLLPVPALRLARAAQAKDAAGTKRLNDQFQPLWALFGEFGSFRVMYAIADILGLAKTRPPLPILPPPASARPRIEAALKDLI
ncbi:dihydrodipicolinate synthase family protein [Terrihabitans soli]|uniref:Dihydrodipicolinate synthase family protein n=1 Tax=Terrihabitans soli TaxID=708113 RepID=A0A6S6R046_9HYPH|nr:dihydrodipicolinate synthase family protein [Terrihabitans soli]BCJ92338.1 dihydrodipicolinate synthase family protein [Terrihabitans soli]